MKSYYSQFYNYADGKKSESVKWTRIFNRMQYDDFDIVVGDKKYYWIEAQASAMIISQDFRKELKKYMRTKGILPLV